MKFSEQWTFYDQCQMLLKQSNKSYSAFDFSEALQLLDLLNESDFSVTKKGILAYWIFKGFKGYSMHSGGFNSKKKNRLQAQVFIGNVGVRRGIFELHGNICLKCGSTERIEMDHIVPVSLGGENTMDNLQPLCKICNIKKGKKIVDYRKKSNGRK